ncbi:hypothetical protein LJC46_07560 [Desulfovibrio sp. OttesenSCG-928-G15]|nr:hypothetical protein [Desulfovibrio sp. OttesenSCG-928-G15]
MFFLEKRFFDDDDSLDDVIISQLITRKSYFCIQNVKSIDSISKRIQEIITEHGSRFKEYTADSINCCCVTYALAIGVGHTQFPRPIGYEICIKKGNKKIIRHFGPSPKTILYFLPTKKTYEIIRYLPDKIYVLYGFTGKNRLLCRIDSTV